MKANDDGTFDVGVHIADISFFVKPNTALDRDARKRATSVYLVQRAVPMLPPALSEQLASLVPGEDRLTFSVFFTLTKEAKVVKKWFEKTIIRFVSSRISVIDHSSVHRSAAKLSYKDVQDVIVGKALSATVASEHATSDVEDDVRSLQMLAKELRAQRFNNGTLNLESPRLTFQLDDNGMPVDCGQYELTDANYLVQEVSSRR